MTEADSTVSSGRQAIGRAGREGVFARCLREHARQPLVVRQLRRELTALTGDLPTGPALGCLVHLATFLPIVRRLADPCLGGLVARAVEGTAVGAIAATDAGGPGSDLAALTTTVERVGAEVVVGGTKEWVTNGEYADLFVVLARHRPGRHFGAFTLVLVPADAPGVHREPADTAVMSGAGLARVRFDGVRLPEAMLLGRPGRGLAYFMDHITAERLAGGVWTVATGRRILDETVRYLETREIDSTPLWRRSSVRHKMARLAVELRLLDALVEQTTLESERADRIPPVETIMIKAALGPLIGRLADYCLHVRGASGLTLGNRLFTLAADLRAFAIAGGSTETMLDLVAETLPGRSAAGRAG